MHTNRVESPGDRVALARDAGLKRLSAASVLGGAAAGVGVLVVLLEAGAALAAVAGAHPRLITDDSAAVWTAGVVAAIALVSWWYGGYVAGRMARRAGTSHGLAVFVVGLAVGGAMYGLAVAADTRVDVGGRLRAIGIPTGRAQWHWPVVICAMAALAVMLLGALVGGASGERWHGRLLGRALDPAVGPEAEARRRAEEDLARAEELHAGSERRVAQVRSAPATPAPATVPVPAESGPAVRLRRRPKATGETTDIREGQRTPGRVGVVPEEAGEPAAGDRPAGPGPVRRTVAKADGPPPTR